ncbi:MAG: 6-pyruvoyl tetrahydrobiopterin synthase [Planctomycetes bacterium]|nr:6-pyruvoyl tetrahydrobiopterin synthase [Planctomycetota bacterium]
MFEIRRTYRFCASHAVRDPGLSDDENHRRFGDASHPSGHGHNFRLTLVVEGRPDPKTHRVVDLQALDRIVEEQVVAVYDHRNLNADVASLSGRIPTLEMVLTDVWTRLADHVPGGRLASVSLQVDDFLSGSYAGGS